VPFDSAWADEQLGAELGVRQSVTGESGDLGLLGRENLTRLDRALAYRLAGGQEFATGALSKRFGAETVRYLVGGSQLFACVDAPVLATQPFAVHQVGASQVNGDTAAFEAGDGLAVQRLGGPAVAEQRARSGQYAEGPIRPAGLRSFLELSESGRGVLAGTASGRLDELDEGETKDPHVLVLARPLCARQGGLVLAEAVVQHRSQVGGPSDGSSLAPGDCFRGIGIEQSRRLGLVAAPDDE
jgi:hypothetical protein